MHDTGLKGSSGRICSDKELLLAYSKIPRILAAAGWKFSLMMVYRYVSFQFPAKLSQKEGLRRVCLAKARMCVLPNGKVAEAQTGMCCAGAHYPPNTLPYEKHRRRKACCSMPREAGRLQDC